MKTNLKKKEKFEFDLFQIKEEIIIIKSEIILNKVLCFENPDLFQLYPLHMFED